MREDIVFEELIEQIDLILNSSKPLDSFNEKYLKGKNLGFLKR